MENVSDKETVDWWDILVSKIIAADKFEEIFNEFKNLCTYEERVAYSLKVMLDYNLIPQVSISCGDIKNAEKSTKLREQGNKIYMSKPLTNFQCIDALKLYTKSIAYAPYPSEQLALAYANRSAVLITIHKYKECIGDVDRALALPYPNKLRNKLYQRKIKCLCILKHPKIEDTIKEAQCWLQTMSLDNANRKKINDMFLSAKKISASNVPKIQDIAKVSVPKLKVRSAEIACASDAVTIKYNEQYGRHIVATRNISSGEIIAIEKPYVIMLDPNQLQTHCSACLEVSWANIPCNYCTHAMYCSEKCKALDWKKYHDIECNMFSSLLKMNFQKLHLFNLRLIIHVLRENRNFQSLREEVQDVDNSDDHRTKGFSKNGIFESNMYRSLIGLVTNIEKLEVHNLFRRSAETSVLLYHLAMCTDFFGSSLKDLSELIKNTDVTFVGGLILRHQLLIAANAHSITEEYGTHTIDRGTAVMPFLSLFNHSCAPMILRCSMSTHIVVYTLCPIKKDEQVFDDYGQLFALTPKSMRQATLPQQYYFTCNCVACREDWPLHHQLKSYKSLTKSKEDESKIAGILTKFRIYVYLAEKGYMFEKHMIDDLLKMIDTMYNLVPMPCRTLIEIVEVLKRVYCLYGNRFSIPEL